MIVLRFWLPTFSSQIVNNYRQERNHQEKRNIYHQYRNCCQQLQWLTGENAIALINRVHIFEIVQFFSFTLAL